MMAGLAMQRLRRKRRSHLTHRLLIVSGFLFLVLTASSLSAEQMRMRRRRNKCRRCRRVTQKSLPFTARFSAGLTILSIFLFEVSVFCCCCLRNLAINDYVLSPCVVTLTFTVARINTVCNPFVYPFEAPVQHPSHGFPRQFHFMRTQTRLFAKGEVRYPALCRLITGLAQTGQLHLISSHES